VECGTVVVDIADVERRVEVGVEDSKRNAESDVVTETAASSVCRQVKPSKLKISIQHDSP